MGLVPLALCCDIVSHNSRDELGTGTVPNRHRFGDNEIFTDLNLKSRSRNRILKRYRYRYNGTKTGREPSSF